MADQHEIEERLAALERGDYSRSPYAQKLIAEYLERDQALQVMAQSLEERLVVIEREVEDQKKAKEGEQTVKLGRWQKGAAAIAIIGGLAAIVRNFLVPILQRIVEVFGG